MDFWIDHFRCEVTFESTGTTSLDTTPLRRKKATWILEGKVLLLEFQEKIELNTFQDLWEKLIAQCEGITSAAMYDWDAVDQHPGARILFKRAG